MCYTQEVVSRLNDFSFQISGIENRVCKGIVLYSVYPERVFRYQGKERKTASILNDSSLHLPLFMSLCFLFTYPLFQNKAQLLESTCTPLLLSPSPHSHPVYSQHSHRSPISNSEPVLPPHLLSSHFLPHPSPLPISFPSPPPKQPPTPRSSCPSSYGRSAA